ncbi:MAG TPA: hypothetical protein PLL78_11030 [Fimbriimonadaceae bacterium]|nr:hypothetical protein [Fimbriimonadaceae bacterium]HRJ97208.1 hypothetical protein [Fimbriimonadaceae bacterium]
MKLARWILLIASGGFLLTLVEVRYLHRDKLGEEWQAWIPVVYCALAGLVAFLIAWSPKPAMPPAILFGLGILIGGYGTLLHSEGKPEAFIDLVLPAALVARADGGDEDDESRNSSRRDQAPPVLAPLGITGLSAFALASLIVREEKNSG